jgi:hypothetical protein
MVVVAATNEGDKRSFTPHMAVYVIVWVRELRLLKISRSQALAAG